MILECKRCGGKLDFVTSELLGCGNCGYQNTALDKTNLFEAETMLCVDCGHAKAQHHNIPMYIYCSGYNCGCKEFSPYTRREVTSVLRY